MMWKWISVHERGRRDKGETREGNGGFYVTEIQRTEYLRKESLHQERWGMETGLKEANTSKALCFIGVIMSQLDSTLTKRLMKNYFVFDSDNSNNLKL